MLAKWEFEPTSAWFKVWARLVSKKQTQGGAQGPDSFSDAQAASIAGKAPSPAAPCHHLLGDSGGQGCPTGHTWQHANVPTAVRALVVQCIAVML